MAPRISDSRIPFSKASEASVGGIARVVPSLSRVAQARVNHRSPRRLPRSRRSRHASVRIRSLRRLGNRIQRALSFKRAFDSWPKRAPSRRAITPHHFLAAAVPVTNLGSSMTFSRRFRVGLEPARAAAHRVETKMHSPPFRTHFSTMHTEHVGEEPELCRGGGTFQPLHDHLIGGLSDLHQRLGCDEPFEGPWLSHANNCGAELHQARQGKRRLLGAAPAEGVNKARLLDRRLHPIAKSTQLDKHSMHCLAALTQARTRILCCRSIRRGRSVACVADPSGYEKSQEDKLHWSTSRSTAR